MGIRNMVMTLVMTNICGASHAAFQRRFNRTGTGAAWRVCPRYPRHLQQLGLQTHQGALPGWTRKLHCSQQLGGVHFFGLKTGVKKVMMIVHKEFSHHYQMKYLMINQDILWKMMDANHIFVPLPSPRTAISWFLSQRITRLAACNEVIWQRAWIFEHYI